MPTSPRPTGGRAVTVTVPGEPWVDLWPELGPGEDPPVDLVVWDVRSAPSARVRADAQAVVLPYLQPADHDLLTGLASLRLLQTLTAGYEGVLPHLEKLPGTTLCNARGVHDASTAELTVGLMIAGRRGLGEYARAQPEGRWLAGTRPSLADSRVLLVGAGSVGAAIARRLDAFEVRITRVAGHARDDGHGHVHGVDELPGLLPAHDVVVLAVPLTDATRGLADAAFLAAMPDGALLVNVARGPVVVTGALVAELASGRLRAALDVTDPEPLPPDHPLWTTPNTLISPHVGGDTTAFAPRGRALLREQFTRLAAGEEPLNVVA